MLNAEENRNTIEAKPSSILMRPPVNKNKSETKKKSETINSEQKSVNYLNSNSYLHIINNLSDDLNKYNMKNDSDSKFNTLQAETDLFLDSQRDNRDNGFIKNKYKVLLKNFMKN